MKRREALEAERDCLLLEHEISALKESKSPEYATMPLRETVGDYVDPRWILQDPALNASALAPASFIGDRRGGMNWPIFRTEWELNIIRGTARLLADTSPHAQAVLESLVNYVVGKGFTYKAVPRPDQTVGPRTIRKAQQVIAEFVEENEYWDLERELFRRDLRDGEDFVHVMPEDTAGHAIAKTIEPEYCTEAGRDYADPVATHINSSDSPGSSWMFGVHTLGDDTTQVLGYNVYTDVFHASEYLNSRQVVHTKCNVDRVIKRGLSDFYPITMNVDQARKLIRNMADGAALQASIAYIRKFQKGTQQSNIQAFNTQKTDFQVARYSVQQPGQMSNVQRHESGRIVNIADGMDFQYGPMGNSNAPNFQLVAQLVLRTIGVRWQMPEGMISGDYSAQNFASALVAESPFALCVLHRQQQQGNRHRKVMMRVLKLAALAGRFNRLGLSWNDLKHLVDIQAVPTAPIGRDKKTETDRLKVLNDDGIISTDTRRSQEGFDEQEKEKVERERSEKQADPNAAVADGTEPNAQVRRAGQPGQPGQRQFLGHDGKRPEAEGLAGNRGYLGEAGGNPNHDKSNGQFSSGNGGASAPGDFASGKAVTITADHADKITDKSGTRDLHEFKKRVNTTVQKALQSGRDVHLETSDGKKRKIVSIADGSLKGDDGIMWGVAPILHGAKLHIAAAANALHPANIIDKAAAAFINARRKIDPFDHARPMGESINESTSRAALAASLATCEDLPEATRAVLKDFMETSNPHV
jgi:hypothetical protein